MNNKNKYKYGVTYPVDNKGNIDKKYLEKKRIENAVIQDQLKFLVEIKYWIRILKIIFLRKIEEFKYIMTSLIKSQRDFDKYIANTNELKAKTDKVLLDQSLEESAKSNMAKGYIEEMLAATNKNLDQLEDNIASLSDNIADNQRLITDINSKIKDCQKVMAKADTKEDLESAAELAAEQAEVRSKIIDDNYLKIAQLEEQNKQKELFDKLKLAQENLLREKITPEEFEKFKREESEIKNQVNAAKIEEQKAIKRAQLKQMRANHIRIENGMSLGKLYKIIGIHENSNKEVKDSVLISIDENSNKPKEEIPKQAIADTDIKKINLYMTDKYLKYHDFVYENKQYLSESEIQKINSDLNSIYKFSENKREELEFYLLDPNFDMDVFNIKKKELQDFVDSKYTEVKRSMKGAIKSAQDIDFSMLDNSIANTGKIDKKEVVLKEFKDKMLAETESIRKGLTKNKSYDKKIQQLNDFEESLKLRVDSVLKSSEKFSLDEIDALKDDIVNEFNSVKSDLMNNKSDRKIFSKKTANNKENIENHHAKKLLLDEMLAKLNKVGEFVNIIAYKDSNSFFSIKPKKQAKVFVAPDTDEYNSKQLNNLQEEIGDKTKTLNSSVDSVHIEYKNISRQIDILNKKIDNCSLEELRAKCSEIESSINNLEEKITKNQKNWQEQKEKIESLKQNFAKLVAKTEADQVLEKEQTITKAPQPKKPT